MIIANLGASRLQHQFEKFHNEQLLSRVINDLIKEISLEESALNTLFKTFYPFIQRSLHTIASGESISQVDEDSLFNEDYQENSLEAAVFNLINIFIEIGKPHIKLALRSLIDPIIKIMLTSDAPQILEKGAICLKNFLKYSTKASDISVE